MPIPQEPQFVQGASSGLMLRKDLVIWCKTINNYDMSGNDCFAIRFAGEKELLRLTDETEIAEAKAMLGYN